MLDTTLKYLNGKVKGLNYFNVQHELVEKIERDGQVFPAVAHGSEYKPIDLDAFGSLCYWRLNGEVNTTSQESETTIGQDYQYDIPLRFIGFARKQPSDDPYFALNMINGVIGVVTNQSALLSKDLKAKRINITSTKFNIDTREIEQREYENKKDYKADKIRFTHAYISIDFNLRVITKSRCLDGICADC